MPDKPRTFRAPDDLYETAADIAAQRDLGRPRGQRDGLSGYLRLALRAYVLDPSAAESDLGAIVRQHS